MIDWLKIVLVIGALVGLLGAVRCFGTRYRWQPEWQRKTLHMALGLTALSFPWLFSAIWPVWVICALGALILVALRSVPYLRRRLGSTLHDVNRESSGELLFALAIALFFALAHETPLYYVVPLAILTAADSAAALVGAQWGRHPFVIPHGHKSWEGVATFAGAALLITVAGLAWLTALPLSMLLLVAIPVALMTTLIEAIAWHGHDNLLIPLTGYLALMVTLAAPPTLLLYQMVVVGGVTVFFMPVWQQLQPHTALTGLLVLNAVWLGGPLLWLVILLLVLFGHLFAEQHSFAEQRWHREIVMRRFDTMPTPYWPTMGG